MIARSLAAPLATALGLLVPLVLGAAEGPRCGLAAVPTLVGFDTATGRALLALPSGDDSRWLVSWQQGEETARLFREPAELGRFGGSIGPGPVFGFRHCGEGCLQPLSLDGREWQPLGEPILAPVAATVNATHDLDGHPWTIVHASSERPGFTRAWAFRLEAGEWRSKGKLDVTGLAAPGALPAPWHPQGVVTGTGLFSDRGEPRNWVSGLPADRGGTGAQVVAFDRKAAAFLSPEGSIYRSDDSGATWRLSAWTPWGTGEAEPWHRGTDYTLDLPVGGPSGVLPILWFDRRLEGRESLIYTEMTPGGRWRQVATGPARIPTSAGEDLPAVLVLRGEDGRWSSVFGCVVSGGGPRLVVTELAGGRITPPRLVKLVP